MKVIIRLFCLLLKFIEELLMRIKLIGDTEVHLPHICDDVGYFVGARDVTIIQGADFDPTSGVYATDGVCGLLPYDVSPSEINTCEVGQHTLIYSTTSFSKVRTVTVVQAEAPTITVPQGAITCDSTLCNAKTDPCTNTIDVGTTLNTLQGITATDAHGRSVQVTCLEGSSVTYNESGTFYLHYSAEDRCGNVGTATRTITVVGGSFSGIEDVSISQGTAFNPRSGVSAHKFDGTSVPFTVTPSTFDACSLGAQVYTYSAEGVESATRTVTVTPIASPTISGVSQPINVNVGEEFDPLSGVSAVDGHGNTVTVTVALRP